MKREFLQTLQVNENPLPKEVIDAIMAENGRDIQKAKAAYADYDTLKTRLEEAEGKLAGHQEQENWEEKYNRAVREYESQLKQLTFDNRLEVEVMAAKGRSAKAIAALLDLEALKESEDQPLAIREALENLKNDCAYLFDSEVPPPYARGTGAHSAQETKAPASLAGALREKFERK